MPRSAASGSTKKGLYQRGKYWLDWDTRADGSFRSPYLAIFWYDSARGRTRSATTGTGDVSAAEKALDAKYLETEKGVSTCPHCGQPMRRAGFLVTNALNNYQVGVAEKRGSKDAIKARLNHVYKYIATLPDPGVICEQVDEDWIERFREWMAKQPIISPTGKHRTRSIGTIEASVIQLQAAINYAERRRDISTRALFKPRQASEVNRTPTHRADIKELAKMFRYALVLDHKPEIPADVVKVMRQQRQPLLRFLRISIATVCRPDAAYDFSTEKRLQQWLPQHSVIQLNPKGRRQTRKYRATVKCPRQLVSELNATKDRYVGVRNVRTAWDNMATEIGLPSEGEAGQKLIRRSMGQLLRDPRRKVPEEMLEIQMGHRPISSTTDVYAPYLPDYLAPCVKAIERIIDEIEKLAPGAYHRKDTGESVKESAVILSFGSAKSG